MKDIHDIIEEIQEKALLDSNAGWVLGFRALEARLNEQQEHIVMLEERIAMYDTPSIYEDNGHTEQLADFAQAVLDKTAETVSEPAPTQEVADRKEAKPGERANGLKCLFCNTPLVGSQKKFCSKGHANRFYYVQSQNPDASVREVATLIAGSGFSGPSQKRRKYKKFDKAKAQENIRRALDSKVPAQT